MSPQAKENRAFLWAHTLLLCVVLIGFARSFYLRGLFLAHPLSGLLQLHGLALSCWFGLTTLQAWLAQSARRGWHRRLAWLAVPVLIAVVASAAQVNTAVALQLASASDPENMFVWANYMSLLSFVVLVALAVRLRRRLAAHRRLMLFASISIIGPAFARVAFWPWVGLGLGMAPALAGAGMLLMVLMAVGYDLVTLRRVQAATLGGLAGLFLPLIVGMAVAISGVGFALVHRG